MLPTSLPGGMPSGMTAARPTSPRAASAVKRREFGGLQRRPSVEFVDRFVGAAVGNTHHVVHGPSVPGHPPTVAVTAGQAAEGVRDGRDHDLVDGQRLEVLRAVEQVGQAIGQRRADAGGGLDRVGELGRVGGGHRHLGHGRVGPQPLGGIERPPRCADRR